MQILRREEVVSFFSYVEAYQPGRWDWRMRLGTRATKRPKAKDITRLTEPDACPGQAGGGWNGKEQGRGLLRLGPLIESC